jgi:hypothetical protein
MSESNIKVVVRQYRRKRILKERDFDCYEDAEKEALQLAKRILGLSIQIYIINEIETFLNRSEK